MLDGKRIKEMRLSKGISQTMLAKAIGTSQAYIAKIECGTVDPSLSNVNKIVDILEENYRKCCGEIMTNNVVSVEPDTKIYKAINIMTKLRISQMPVMRDGLCYGSISEEIIIRNMGKGLTKRPCKTVMEKAFPIVPYEEDVSIVKALLEDNDAILVCRDSKLCGIITKTNLLSLL